MVLRQIVDEATTLRTHHRDSSLQIYSQRRTLTFGKSEYNRIGKLGNAQAIKRHFGGKPNALPAEFEESKVDGGSEEKKDGGK
jgi:hypothetical protein